MGSTYLTMKMTVATSLLVLIALINGVQMNDPLIEDSSGDGESTSMTYNVSLIDDNGDIHTEYPFTMEPETNVSVKLEALPEDSSPKASNENTFTVVMVNSTETVSDSFSTTSTAAPTEATVVTTTQSPQTNPPTTQSTKPDTTTAMPDVTTDTTTTSTPMPSSEADKVTIVEMETSTFSPEAVEPEKMDKSTESAPKRSTTEPTVLTPAMDRSVCTFVEEHFTCRDELICYGEGEIDCTDYDDEDIGVEADVVKQVSTYNAKSNLKGENDGRPLADAAETMDPGNVKSSAKTEDYAEYDADESDTIETFPPSLVGVASHKRIPFILRPSASTDVSPNATDEIPTTATTKMVEVERFSTTITSQPENKDLEKTLTTSSSSATENTDGSDVGLGLVSQLTTATESVSTTPELSESNSNLTSAETSTADEDIVAPNNTNTVSDDEENVEITTQMNVPTTIELNYRSLGRRSLIRKKRQDNFMESNSSSSQSQTFHVAALESTQRKLRVKVCRLSGDIVCTPVPTLTMCKGKSYCQATSSPADTTESATTRGVETWAIIVIVVCALSGFLTICLLIYLVVTSCKKLKVQPSIEVTTLNYINRGASSNEVA